MIYRAIGCELAAENDHFVDVHRTGFEGSVKGKRFDQFGVRGSATPYASEGQMGTKATGLATIAVSGQRRLDIALKSYHLLAALISAEP